MASVDPGASRRAILPRRLISPGTGIALVVFILLMVGAPLAFGAVDRLSQIGLLGLFALGVLARPPALVPLSRWGNRLAIMLLVIVVAKEFAPAAWFGAAEWRSTLVQNFGVDLPWTHHPEPARAFDALLALGIAIVWFLWVRTLASERENRPVLAWGLFVAAATVAAVAFATRGIDSEAIYGLRYTPGWRGFGPFPNRNHTADFLAMGLAIGCGCLTWAGTRKRWFLVAIGALLAAFILVGLLATESRGGLIAGGIGLLCFTALALRKVRSRRALAVAAGGVFTVGAIALGFGAPVLSRFSSHEAGTVSNLMRVSVWKDTLGMWRDAPLFGHGLGTFPGLFGMYQQVRLENQIVLHPESSWLQWLTELGAIPVLLSVVALVIFTAIHLRHALERHRSFFLHAGAFSAAAVLLAHAVFDVPAHRWATAAFGLAALALACPLRIEGRRCHALRRTALVPASIAVFWALPFGWDWPPWSPLTLTRLLAREQITGGVPLVRFQQALLFFPLNAELNQAIGMRQVRILGRNAPAVWQRHFAIASRLVPGWWTLPAEQARAVAHLAPGLALGYWQQAIDRCDLHREDVLRTAFRETGAFPLAPASWGRWIETRPELLLAFAQLLPEDEARHYYTLWWKERAPRAALGESEVEAFYREAPRWGTRAQFDEWMQHRAGWKKRDFRRWATLLLKWQDAEAAFRLLAEFIDEPELPKHPPTASREQLETRWRTTPRNAVNAQQLAASRARAGETEKSEEIVLAVAAQDTAPPWFLQKAGYIYARRGLFDEAVAMLLRLKV